MTRSLTVLTILCALAAPATSLHGAPVPVAGDIYLGQGVNFPNAYGPSPVAFDGSAELLGGPSPEGMNWNESDTFLAEGVWPGGLPTTNGPTGTLAEFSGEGTILEFAWSTEDGDSYNNSGNDVWAVGVADLDFGRPIKALDNTTFAYWTVDGVPQQIQPALLSLLGIEFGPHPSNPAVPQVVFFRDDDDKVNKSTAFPDGKFLFGFSDDEGEATSGVLEGLLIVPTVNDIHLGVMIVPEPSTAYLVLIGGLLMLSMARRRRFTAA